MSTRMKVVIASVVTTIWALNFLAGLVPPLHYKPDQAINGIFMTIVGAMLVKEAREKKNGSGSE